MKQLFLILVLTAVVAEARLGVPHKVNPADIKDVVGGVALKITVAKDDEAGKIEVPGLLQAAKATGAIVLFREKKEKNGDIRYCANFVNETARNEFEASLVQREHIHPLIQRAPNCSGF